MIRSIPPAMALVFLVSLTGCGGGDSTAKANGSGGSSAATGGSGGSTDGSGGSTDGSGGSGGAATGGGGSGTGGTGTGGTSGSGGTSATGGAGGGGTGGAGTGGAGAGGTVAALPGVGQATVAGGVVATSKNFKAILTLGESPGGNTAMKSTNQRLNGGLVGKTQQ